MDMNDIYYELMHCFRVYHMSGANSVTGAATLSTHAAFANTGLLPSSSTEASAAIFAADFASAADDVITPADAALDAVQSGVRAEDGQRVWLDVDVDGQEWGRIEACIFTERTPVSYPPYPGPRNKLI